MIPHGVHIHLLTIADAAAFILANRLTPESIREIILKFSQELEKILPFDSKCDVDAAKVSAVIRALAYRRDD